MISLDSPPVYTIALLGPKNSTFEADFFRTDIRGASRGLFVRWVMFDGEPVTAAL